MEGNKTKLSPILGSNQTIFPKPGFLHSLVNVRCDASGVWSNDVGWEPLLNTLSGTTFANPIADGNTLFEPTRFLSYWKSSVTGVSYYLYERDGILQYDWGNKGLATSRNVQLATGRNIGGPTDIGTQLIDCKGFALLINGHDAPIKFWGHERVEPFSWSLKPGALTLYAPQPETIEPAPTATSVDPNKTTIKFGASGDLGLGDSENGSVNTYGYRVAFLSNTGSRSPMSEMSVVNWSIDNANQVGRYGVLLASIPKGPKGTVGRIIYRTRNMRDGLQPGYADVYEAFTINENVTTQAIDVLPDSRLALTATSVFGSTALTENYGCGTMFDNRVWLARNNTIIYSEANLYEQFPTFNYLETGNGSPITALVAYYNGLLVFRERSIDIIRRTDTGAYTISVLDSSVGTTATNTIKVVPGVGVMFLATDGVRAIKGGLDGGSIVKNEEIGKPLTDEWERLSRGSLSRACASLSLRDAEYWVHYPADGSSENTRGAVYHLVTGGWSLRNNDEGATAATGALRFTSMTVDDAGYTVLGTAPVNASGLVSTWKSWPGIGLQVWSRTPTTGRQLTYTSTGPINYNWSVADGSHIVSSLISPELDMGSLDITKTILHVLIEGITCGNNLIPLVSYEDASYSSTAAKSLPAQLSTHYNTVKAQAIYELTATDKPTAKWGTAIWEEGRRYQMRFDVASNGCSSYRFKIATASSFAVYGWTVAYSLNGNKTVYHYG